MNSADDLGGKRLYRQAARRYIESELVSISKELIELRAESVRLRDALSSIASAEPITHDHDGLETHLTRIREIARHALAAGQ